MATQEEDGWVGISKARQLAASASSHCVLLAALRGQVGYRIKAGRTEFAARDLARLGEARSKVDRVVPARP